MGLVTVARWLAPRSYPTCPPTAAASPIASAGSDEAIKPGTYLQVAREGRIAADEASLVRTQYQVVAQRQVALSTGAELSKQPHWRPRTTPACWDTQLTCCRRETVVLLHSARGRRRPHNSCNPTCDSATLRFTMVVARRNMHPQTQEVNVDRHLHLILKSLVIPQQYMDSGFLQPEKVLPRVQGGLWASNSTPTQPTSTSARWPTADKRKVAA